MTHPTNRPTREGDENVTQTPPDWAIEKAKQLHRDFGGVIVPMAHAFARYIAEHEEAPVDPLVAEAEAIYKDYAMGPNRPMIIAALKRGIEIGGSK